MIFNTVRLCFMPSYIGKYLVMCRLLTRVASNNFVLVRRSSKGGDIGVATSLFNCENSL